MTDFKIIAHPSFASMQAKLRELGGKWPKELQKRNKKIAEWIAIEVENEYSSEHPPRSGDASASIRDRSTQTTAAVWMGSEAAPYVLGQNFGSNQGPNKEQFPQRKDPDYFLYTTVEENLPDIKKEHLKGVDEVMSEAFPD
jgi:hypothetical protein